MNLQANADELRPQVPPDATPTPAWSARGSSDSARPLGSSQSSWRPSAADRKLAWLRRYSSLRLNSQSSHAAAATVAATNENAANTSPAHNPTPTAIRTTPNAIAITMSR
jgi:hypothetical protein